MAIPERLSNAEQPTFRLPRIPLKHCYGALFGTGFWEQVVRLLCLHFLLTNQFIAKAKF